MTPPTPAAPRQFAEVAAFYDVLMLGVPYARWVEYLEELLDSRGARPRTVLDLACGTGNVTELLAERFASVTGVDLTPEMIREARAKADARGLSVEYHVADAAEFDLPGRRFDLCVSLFDSLNYIVEPDRLEAAMVRVRAHLERNALFIFDMNTDYALVNGFFDQRSTALDADLRYEWKSRYDAATRLCTIEMRFEHRQPDGAYREVVETHEQFAYRRDEIEAMLRAAGFGTVEALHAYRHSAPARYADRIFYVARAV